MNRIRRLSAGSPVVIIQARMGSTRFPGKIMADLGGKPVLQHVIERCYAIPGVRRVVIAAGGEDRDQIYLTGYRLDVPVFFGSEHDVLGRYLEVARRCGAETIMRITSDCPMLQPDLCSDVIELYQSGDCSLAAIGWPMTYPKGYGCEVFSTFTLQLANEMATDQHDREHVTPWMERNLRCKYLTQDKDESHLNYCVDTPDDLARLRQII